LDNDNDLDLIYANPLLVAAQILRFDGKRLLADTNVSNMSSFVLIPSAIRITLSLAVGDINGDAIADLVVGNDFNQ
jgi:hypothetical protein